MSTNTPFQLPRVKVCGILALEDVRAALELGLEAVGFVEYPRSPRAINPTRAAALSAELPPEILRVAVLVDRTPSYAERWASSSGANAVQLCGAESADDWRAFPHPILRRVAVDETAESEIARWQGVAQGYVLDHPDAPGGSGHAVDLQRAAALASAHPVLLAGGLDAQNVAQRVRSVRPAGVDASSRLESEPGTKNPALVRAFVHAAREALGAIGH